MNIARTTLGGLGLLIAAGTVWLYAPALDGRFLTHMDDDEYLRQSVRMKGLTWNAVEWAFATTAPYYHPLPRLSHVLDYQIYGTTAAGHHATSVVVHALNAAIVFGFLWTLLGAVASLSTSERLAVAFGGAVVFAIHPLQVESVAWMSGRTQLLCAAFGVGSVWAYVAGARRWLVGTLFVAAVLCKPVAVVLPFVMLAVDYFPLRRYEEVGWSKLLREKAALIVVSAVVSAATLITESRVGGLMEPLESTPPWTRVCLAVQSLTFYPWKLAWPAWLSPYYPMRLGFSLRPALVLASALCVGIVTIVGVRKRRQLPALAAGWGAYAILILPVSGLAQTGGQAVADRYAYMSMVPLLLLAGGALVWLWRRCPTTVRFVPVCLLVVEFCYFGVRTRAQIPIWRNDETLWRGVLAQYPDSDLANELVAQALLDQDRIDEALQYAQRAVEVASSAETRRNLGIALMRADRIQEAIGEFDRALQLKPGLADAHYNLGIALMRQSRLPEAMDEWQRALRIQPDYVEAHYNLGVALMKLGRLPEAIGQWEQALRIQPDYAEVHYNLGLALVRLGQVPAAIGHWEQALRIQPGYAEAHCNLGVALEELGKREEAIHHYEQALKLKPDLAEVHYNLGVVLLGVNRVPEAVQHWEQALRLKPDMAVAHYNLGTVFEKQGRVHEAIEHYEQALRLKPDYAAAQERLMRLRAVR